MYTNTGIMELNDFEIDFVTGGSEGIDWGRVFEDTVTGIAVGGAIGFGFGFVGGGFIGGAAGVGAGVITGAIGGFVTSIYLQTSDYEYIS